MSGHPAAWTIDVLARLAAATLASGAPAQTNGRIREVPDVRTIRWYTSIGLLDRPAAMRGRTALYGRSHLAQLVAIKRLQAGGLTVAAVQERLLGADESAVEAIAMLPADLDALVARAEQKAAAEARSADEDEAVPSAARARFWVTPAVPAPLTAPEALAHNGPTTPITPIAPTARPTMTTTDVAPPVHGIRLATDVTLLLPPGRVPDAAARAAIAEAARPLLDLLDRLGLSEA